MAFTNGIIPLKELGRDFHVCAVAIDASLQYFTVTNESNLQARWENKFP